MNNLQSENNLGYEQLANDVAELVKAGVGDSVFLRIGEMFLSHAVTAENPDITYKNYPAITQFVTEENDRLGTPYKFPHE